MVILGVHALPSSAGVVDKSGFSDLPEEAIVAKGSSDPHTEYRRGVLCVLHHDVFVEGVGFIYVMRPPEAIWVLLASMVGVVSSLSNIDVTTTTTTTGDPVRHALSPTSAITGNTHRTLIPLI